MRTLSLAVLLAACSSSSGTGSNIDATIEILSMTCGSAVTDYCKSTVCDQSLAVAEKDAALCHIVIRGGRRVADIHAIDFDPHDTDDMPGIRRAK